MNTAQHKQRPRVVLLTYPGLCGASVIERMAEEEGIDLIGVGLSGRVFKGSNHLQSVVKMIRRTGWAFTAYAVTMTDIAWAILRCMGRPASFSSGGFEVLHFKEVNGTETVDWLRRLQPDYVVSCYFNQLIGPSVRSTCRLGCLNMHAALLPGLRGPEPSYRALERDLAVTGLTVHEIDDGIDTGRLLHQESRSVPPGLSLGEMDLLLWADGARVLSGWLAGKSQAPGYPRMQDPEADDYDSWPNPEEIRKFRQTGKQLFRMSAFIAAMRDALHSQPPRYLIPTTKQSLSEEAL